jgi:restriction endonuclease S subunit
MNRDFSLPNGWKLLSIGEIAESINPGFPSGKHNQEGKGIPHLRPMNISRNGEIDFSQVKYVENKEYHPLCNGDVLFNNTNSPELVGKTTYINKDTNWAYSNHMTRIRLKRDIAFPAWVAMALHFNYMNGFFKLNCRHHVNQASINSSYLANKVSIPLPPLPEQERIVARIEELFTQLDAGTAALRRVQAELKRYKASVLKAACEGKLFGDTGLTEGQLPEGWQSIILSDVTSTIKDVDHKMPKAANTNIPYISTKNFIGDDEIDYENAKHISLSDYRSLTKKVVPEYNDILLSRYGTVGQVRKVKTNRPFQASYSIAIIKPLQSKAISEYIVLFLRSELGQEQIRRNIRASSQPDLGLEYIRKFILPLPSIAEQRRIVVEVERLFSFAQEIEAEVDTSLSHAKRLRGSILNYAFTGRLI